MRHSRKKQHQQSGRAKAAKAPAPATEVVAMEENKVEALAPTQSSPESPKEPEKKSSVVDTVFDVVTGWTVTGLEATQRGLEVSARWLDARAKAVGELKQKLAANDVPEQKQAA